MVGLVGTREAVAGIQAVAVGTQAVAVGIQAVVVGTQAAVADTPVEVDSPVVAVVGTPGEVAVATTVGKVAYEVGPDFRGRAASRIDRSDRRSFCFSCSRWPQLRVKTMRGVPSN